MNDKSIPLFITPDSRTRANGTSKNTYVYCCGMKEWDVRRILNRNRSLGVCFRHKKGANIVSKPAFSVHFLNGNQAGKQLSVCSIPWQKRREADRIFCPPGRVIIT